MKRREVERTGQNRTRQDRTGMGGGEKRGRGEKREKSVRKLTSSSGG
jgi:hypothetical protein